MTEEIDGYYSLRDFNEQEVDPTRVAGYLLTEEDAENLEVGAVFTGHNGQWYIKVDEGDYRAWTFLRKEAT